MRSKVIIGVMGGAQVSNDVYAMAYDLGVQLASEGWIVLTGGRNAGVMLAAAEGAKSVDGLTIGVLPSASKKDANPFIDICIPTNMGIARNAINVLSSDAIVACPGGAGTISEIALALKSHKYVISLDFELGQLFQHYTEMNRLVSVKTVSECIQAIKHALSHTPSQE